MTVRAYERERGVVAGSSGVGSSFAGGDGEVTRLERIDSLGRGAGGQPCGQECIRGNANLAGMSCRVRGRE